MAAARQLEDIRREDTSLRENKLSLLSNSDHSRQGLSLEKEDNEEELEYQEAIEAQRAEEISLENQERLREMQYMAFRAGEVSEAVKNQEVAEESKPSIWRYTPALLVATLKDLLDLIGLGSLPLLGTAVTICFSILIFLLLLLAKTNSTLTDSRFAIRRAIIFLVGITVEAFAFGLNLFPIEILTVYAIYWLDKHLSAEQIEKFSEIVKRVR